MAVRRLLNLRYPATCQTCKAKLIRGTRAWWDPAAHAATCVACDLENPAGPFTVVDPDFRGVAGGSAQAEHDRRASKPNHNRRATAAWQKGSDGEQHLSSYLRKDANGRFTVLDDRRIPNSRANIDHLAIAPSGIYVIDAKNYTGKASRRVDGILRWRTEHLIVNGRDRTKLITGMKRQTEAVRTALGLVEALDEVPIVSVLCFVGNGDWGKLAPTFTVNGVHVLWPRPLKKLLRKDGPLTGEHRAKLARLLSTQLSPASRQA